MISIAVNREALNTEAGQAQKNYILNSIREVTALVKQGHVYFQFVSEDGRTVYGDLGTGLEAPTAGEELKHFYAAVPNELLLQAALGSQSGFMALPKVMVDKEGARLAPFKAIFIAQILLASTESYDQGSPLFSLLRRLLSDSIIDIDPSVINDLTTVKRVDIQRYLKLAIQVVPLKINEFLEAVKVAMATTNRSA
jgi:hypothetical protein